jgi:hypothetical protein
MTLQMGLELHNIVRILLKKTLINIETSINPPHTSARIFVIV